ncbi:hypothetical protein JZP76_11990 [Enterococcus faecalis]|uniref:hypothetical protein n=1 Tax=Enterococcus TaxID=1350 RepID=UPI001362A251|nr:MULTISPECIES: hypothetical protein [Enterococcus]EGO9125937.1 hypothetical protein [Enterococcus faecalis]MBW4131329.1 hypothetical protein [Enterococcus faecalis]MDQ8650696.1 hypothetical protein [Enterococcus sp. FR042]QHN68494.1 hypothetical protein F1M88_12870 [Enterococcus faecalis]QUE59011.1 hypothetical protein JZP76_11990 [Enterococcus faecalis]
MGYSERQQKQILKWIQNDRRAIQEDREALKKADMLTSREMEQFQSELEFLREMELENKGQRL